MNSFDVSVNLLTDKVFSDKFLFNNKEERRNQPPHKPVSVLSKPHVHDIPVTVSMSSCHGVAQMPFDIAILLLLPATFMSVFVLLITDPRGMRIGGNINTLVACAVLLSTPAVLTVWHPRTSGKRSLLWHMLLLHSTALLAVLRAEHIWGVSLVWAVVFAHVGFQLQARRLPCLLLVALNVANVVLLLVNEQRYKEGDPIAWGLFTAVLCNAAVVMASATTYAVCYILS